MKPAVFNASPLIILAKAGYLEVVPALFSRTVIPRAVAGEVRMGTSGDPARNALEGLPWLQTVDVVPVVTPLASWRLGVGETEVLEYARLHPGVVAVLDDRAARRAAKTLNIPLSGTLGILIAAARIGALPSLDEAIDRVKRAGLYLDDTTIAGMQSKGPDTP